MKKETDLIKIKRYANLLLTSGIAKMPCSPAIVRYLFTPLGKRQRNPAKQPMQRKCA